MTTVAEPVVELDLTPYILRQWGHDEPGFWGRQQGLKAAKELGMLGLAGRPISLKMPPGVRMDLSFMKALLGPLARKVGPLNLKLDLQVEGGFEGGLICGRYGRFLSLADQINDYLNSEDERVRERKLQKAKDEFGPEWTAPIGFFIPDTGTLVRLEKRWEFRLYNERRNTVCDQLGIVRARGYHEVKKPCDVALAAGTLLTVSRVYIRQGVKDYSSITFNIKKGAKAYVKDDNGKWQLTVLKKGARFWAKLSDVNKMRVVVDKTTLAEN